ncbi:MAG: hypothetical protein QG579_199 [Patescibacteria group bacterium]|jgi:hypothetical protein|nr:hypothetical protein [Patescibacteria group bacterium]
MEKPPEVEQFEDSLYKEILDKNIADIKETEEQNRFWRVKLAELQRRLDAILNENVTNVNDRRAILEDKDGQVAHLQKLISVCEKSITDGERFKRLLYENGKEMLIRVDEIEQMEEVEQIKREDGESIEKPEKLPN